MEGGGGQSVIFSGAQDRWLNKSCMFFNKICAIYTTTIHDHTPNMKSNFEALKLKIFVLQLKICVSVRLSFFCARKRAKIAFQFVKPIRMTAGKTYRRPKDTSTEYFSITVAVAK